MIINYQSFNAENLLMLFLKFDISKQVDVKKLGTLHGICLFLMSLSGKLSRKLKTKYSVVAIIKGKMSRPR